MSQLVRCQGGTPEYRCESRIEPERQLCHECRRYLEHRDRSRSFTRGVPPSKPSSRPVRSAPAITRNAERRPYSGQERSEK